MHKSCKTNQAREIGRWKFSMKKLPMGVMLASDGTEMHVQGQNDSTAGRLEG
jgi:hypothetical protein